MPQSSPEGLGQKLRDRIRYQLLGLRDAARPRVICVGLSKTATTSVCDALEILGYRTIHYAPIARIENGTCRLDWPWWMNRYDAMGDLPVAAMFRELDARFPTARFILTTREDEAWLKSCAKHFTVKKRDAAREQARFQQSLALDRYMFGNDVFDPETFLVHYHLHNTAVRDHFRSSSRFLEMDVGAGQGWAPLCDFLGKPMPAADFPRSNTRTVAWGSEAGAA